MSARFAEALTGLVFVLPSLYAYVYRPEGPPGQPIPAARAGRVFQTGLA